MGEERNLGMSQKMLSPSRSTSSCSSKLGSRQDSWEIVEGLRGSSSCTQEPQKKEGFLLKKRKWPLKGWHKRYFYLDKGILKYAKGPTEMEKGKLHGCIDVGLSVMSVKKSTKCIDLDTEEHIYHLKVKPPEIFEDWVLKLRDHRLYRQNEISVFPHDINTQFFPLLSTTESASSFDPIASPQETQFARQNSLKLASGLNFSCLNNDSKVPAWLQSNDDMDKCAKDLSQCHSYLVEMSQLLQNMEVLHRTYSAPAINAIQVGALESPKKEKGIHRKKWRTKGNNKDPKGSLQVPTTFAGNVRLHASNPNLSTIDYGEEKQYSSGSDSSEFSKMQDDLCHIAHKAYFTLKSAYSTVFAEREKLKQLLEQDSSTTPQILGLKNALAAAVKQNAELKERLHRIHADSLLHDSAPNAKCSPVKESPGEENRPLVHQISNESRLSITDSLTEFYDAQEVLLSSSSSENEVSHHPPISACHAESDKFVFYQDIRWKNKFWGKSMEIVPIGTSHLILPGHEDHYEWNKVTSCIHNILSGQRWIEHYGEIIIKNTKNDNCHCKVTFIKAKYWNPNVHEIEGSVMDKNGKVVYRLFGKWHESLFYGSPSSPICIWRTNPMPKDSELYYGFTKFALRLNEIDPKTKPLLPSTDTRLRPDQRLLEEGNTEGAEAQKQRIEQLQRERRRVLEENNIEHQPRFFRKSSDESWVTNNTYWQLRKDPGFAKLDCPILW
ncbi:hypothetical protein GDO81_012303 [Engystomops pustulosus]|uniref:Oxysterol-binding protein-related protein 3 n=1 Tax=Engystomops pustulosus TaxID=76066 RepID=A0AAV7BKE9_ENGPU|nr:hypothetical protein GDO81_012303 [Engystomops pustulosus]